jgi:bacillopeptidase F
MTSRSEARSRFDVATVPHRTASRSLRTITATALLAVTVSAQAGVIAPELERSLSRGGTVADTAVIVRFSDPVDAERFKITDRRARDNQLLRALKAQTAPQREAINPFLTAHGAKRITDLWIINAVAATLPAASVRELARQPGVERVDLDSYVRGGHPQQLPAPRKSISDLAPLPPVRPPAGAIDGAAGGRGAPAAWNIVAVQAPELWALHQTGTQVVVASMDSGVDALHPDLRRTWRGGTNSWFDPHREEAAPYDALGHGTQALGVILGRSGLGIAPDARWIAAKLYDADGRARMSDIHLAFQWLLDPDGDPATLDAPDVVNASWALTGRRAGVCHLEFSDDLRVLRSAGIVVVLAAGNDGPSPNTSSSPGNNPGALSVGAVDRNLDAGRQNSRGPSACDGTVFPKLAAPGIDVRTTDLSHGGLSSYANVSGSSMAAPHVAGVLALLASAFPAASVDQLESAVLRSAQDLGDSGPDSTFGFGLVRALAAYQLLSAAGTAADVDHLGTRSGVDDGARTGPMPLRPVLHVTGALPSP